MSGVTIDTGVLIALERASESGGERRARAVWMSARQRKVRITVPSAVIVEWWRGQRGPVAHLLDGVSIEPLDSALAHVAGVALSQVRKGPSVVDAIVMASAARRGDIVYTSDIDDLGALRVVFPAVRVLGV
jgi:predicted nucleic acid-binding protein